MLKTFIIPVGVKNELSEIFFCISELQNFCVFERIFRFRMSESGYFQLKIAAAQAITVKLEGNDENFLQSLSLTLTPL
jgi:hypothetical protein